MGLGLKEIILGMGISITGCNSGQYPEKTKEADIDLVRRWVATCCGSASTIHLDDATIVLRDRCKPFESFWTNDEDRRLLQKIARGEIR